MLVGNLAAQRDFTDVRDIVMGYRALIVDGSPGEVYNLSSGTAVSLADVVAMLQSIIGTTLELQTDEALLRPLDTPVLKGDAQKIQASVGWRPRLDLETSLRDIVASLKN